MKEIKIRFIKLGSQSSKLIRGEEKKTLEQICLDEGKMVLGYREVDHFSSDEEILEFYLNNNKKQQTATSYLNQIKKFYHRFDENENPDTTLWITFAEKKLWWAFVDNSKSSYKEEGWTFRDMKDKWKCEDIKGNLLTFENISGALLKTQGFRGTICDITSGENEFPIVEYTKRLINGEKLEGVIKAEENKIAITQSMKNLLKMLHPQDFEYIIDLIFQYSGWRKLTPGAGVEKDLDLDLLMPLTGERAFVQIKSFTDQSEYNKYEEIFYKHNIYDRFFYVYHTAKPEIVLSHENKYIHIISIEEVAKLVVELGLITVLMKKVG